MNVLRTTLFGSLLRRGLLRGLAAVLLLAAAASPCPAETKTSSSATVNNGTASRTATGGEFAAGAEGEASAEASADYSNCGEDSLGGHELSGGKTLASGEIGLINASGSAGGENANASYSVQAGASGQVQAGKNGVQASGEIGLEAELNALAKVGVGDENFGGGAAAEATVNALLKAQGTVGAYIDKKGLTIGLDAKAEAMVSAEASLSLNLTLFGLQTTVTATAQGQAGASASASALVTIGFDGQIYFKVGAGATAGLGGGVTFNAAVDAQQLMAKLGLESLDQLITWCEQLASDPEALAKQLAQDAAKQVGSAVLGQVKDAALAAAQDLAGSAFGLAGSVLGSVGSLPGGGPLASLGSGLQSLFGSGSSAKPPAGSGTGGGGCGGNGTCNGSCGGGCGGTPTVSSGGSSVQPDYRRDSQFNKWSR